MKKGLLTLAVFCFIFMGAAAWAADGDAILGDWLTQKQDAVMQFYKCGEMYCARITWLKEPNDANGKPKLDTKNPDAARKAQPILGMVNAWNLKYAGDNKYEDGTVYAPDDGKTYSCKAKVNGSKLEFRGYMGISLLGRTEVMTRK